MHFPVCKSSGTSQPLFYIVDINSCICDATPQNIVTQDVGVVPITLQLIKEMWFVVGAIQPHLHAITIFDASAILCLLILSSLTFANM